MARSIAWHRGVIPQPFPHFEEITMIAFEELGRKNEEMKKRIEDLEIMIRSLTKQTENLTMMLKYPDRVIIPLEYNTEPN